MSSILIASCPAHGHVTPLLAVAENFVKAGHRVRFLTGTTFADKVAATGATFLPLPPEAAIDIPQLLESPERTRLKGAKAIAYDVEHGFATPAIHQYRALTAALADEPADALLAEPVFLGAFLLLGLARPARPPVLFCGIIPLCINSGDTAPFGLGLTPARYGNRARNAVLARLNDHVWRRAYQLLDDHYRQIHGTVAPYPAIDWGRHADGLIQLTVPSFEYPRSDAPGNLLFTGPLAPTGSAPPLPPWWSDLDGTRPIVHVTQGTAANADYAQAIAPTLAALADDDVLVVVSTGGRPVDTLPPLPANARAAEFLPYDELLPRTAVYVTNGGYGGVHYALRHGVPIVAIGGKEDKPEVGARVAWSGAGRRIRSEHPSPRSVRLAVHAVLKHPHYREASARIGADIAAAPGFAGLASVVESVKQSPCPPSTPPQTSRNAAASGSPAVA